MKRRILSLAAPLAVTGIAFISLAQPAHAEAGQSFDLTLSMTSHGPIVDAGAAGSSPGDTSYVSGVVRSAGTKVGRFGGTCTQLTATNQQCTFTLGLADGQLAIMAGYGPGMNVGGNTALEPIVGGTGKYEGARGQSTSIEHSRTITMHIHLLP